MVEQVAVAESTQAPKPRRFSRRFWVRSAVSSLAVGSGLLGYTVFVEPGWLDVCHYQLRLANIPESWRGRRLVQISDLHIGKVSVEYLKRCMRAVNELEPDLLAITGDFLDHTHGLEGSFDTIFDQLRPARLGTVACLGNHDYGHRWRQTEIADQLIAAAKERGIQVLRDSQITIDGLNIFGIDDYWSPRCNPRQLLRDMKPQTTGIALCHNPDACDKFDWSAFRGIILAGHTHGGQCKPPFLPPPILPVKNRRYTSGFFDLKPGRQLFISRGLGHTFQVRFNCRPEISVFTLEIT